MSFQLSPVPVTNWNVPEELGDIWSSGAPLVPRHKGWQHLCFWGLHSGKVGGEGMSVPHEPCH